MKKSFELFDLVKSLSMSEKRYISMSALAHKSNSTNYKLFRALDSMDAYDPEELRLILKKESLTKNIAVIKQGLYKFIMKSLRNFYSDSDEEIGMYEKLVEAHIMFRKRNINETIKIIDRLEEMALRYENYDVLNLCYKYKRKLSLKRMVLISGTEREVFNQNYSSTIKKLNSDAVYAELRDDLIDFFDKNSVVRSASEHKYLNNFLLNPYLKDVQHATTDRSLELFYNVKGLAFTFLGKYNMAEENLRKQIEVAKKIAMNKGDYAKYIGAFSNLNFLLLRMHCYHDALAAIKELRKIPVIASIEKWPYQIPKEVLADLEIECLLKDFFTYQLSANYEKALEIYSNLEQLAKKLNYKWDEARWEGLIYTVAYVHFILGNYKPALHQLQKILGHSRDNIVYREDIYSYSKILHLITHFEMEDEELSNYLLKSVYKFLTQKNRIYPTDEALLLFMRNRLTKKNTPDQFVHDLKKLKSDLEKIVKSNLEQGALGYFDFIAWIDSKLTKTAFASVMKKKYHVTLPD
jgi:tetratricopeptide (TPR) repeat protein